MLDWLCKMRDKMREPPINVAVVGVGRAGLIHAANFATSVSGAKLVAVSDPHRETLAEAMHTLGVAAGFADYRAVIERSDVHAIVIATPTVLHCEIAVAAALAGKSVLCEKPMAMNVEECAAMIAAAKSAGVVLQIGFMRRYTEDYLHAHQRIQAGEIGEVVQIKTLTHGPSQPRPWMFDLRKSNGPLAEVNSHDLDTVRWLSGGEFEEVYALAGNYRTPAARDEFPDFYDQVLLSARLTNGAQASVSGAQGVQYAYDARCEILGTHGLITIGRLEGGDAVICTNQKTLLRPAVVSWTRLFRDAYLAEDIDFVACVREGRTPRAQGRDGMAAVAAVTAGNASIRDRTLQRVLLPPL